LGVLRSQGERKTPNFANLPPFPKRSDGKGSQI
jgi:hypothetical protein